jgi:8-oxo-dGTP pyrophosphatase MutT (NUDIX family)
LRVASEKNAELVKELAVQRLAIGPSTGSTALARDNAGVPSPFASRPRRLSCGIVILSATRELLLCHVTGQRHWDLPKGGIHDAETPCQAALRETVEETGLILAPQSLSDLGSFAYTGKKDLHLFATTMERVDPRGLCCESTFVERGSNRTLPEMDAFGWFAFDRVRELCTPRMATLLGEQVGLDTLLDRLLAFHAERIAA